jgi:hypothetical protein
MLAAILGTGCGAGGHLPAPPPEAVPTATAWPEADLLFRTDPRWLGADGATSVHLGGERTLWLFGQTHVDPLGSGDRAGAFSIANSAALQDGLDPSTARLDFVWRETGGIPRAFASTTDATTWLWPSHGVRLGDVLTLFFRRLRSVATAGPFRFEVIGTVAFRVADPDAHPRDWELTPLALPVTRFSREFATNLLVQDDHVLAFAIDDSTRNEAYVLRWRRDDVVAGDLLDPAWWVAGRGWVADRDLTGSPTPLFRGASTDYSVTPDPTRPRMLQLQSQGDFNAFGARALAVRVSDQPQGPYSALQRVFTPSDLGPDDFANAGKVHAHLRGADLVATYVPTSLDESLRLTDPRLLYPRFVRLTFPR